MAATRMSARERVPREVRRARVAHRHRGVPALALPEEKEREGPPHDGAPADDDDVRAGDGNVRGRERLDDRERRAWRERLGAPGEKPEARRGGAVDVLGRRDEVHDRGGHVCGERLLHDDAVHARVVGQVAERAGDTSAVPEAAERPTTSTAIPAPPPARSMLAE